MKQGRLKKIVTGSLQRSISHFRGKLWDQNPGATQSYFSTLFLREKLREEIWFICMQDTEEFLLPNEWVSESTGFTDKTVAEVQAGNHPDQRNPIVLCCKCMRKSLFLFQWILRMMWSSRSRGNFWGAKGPVTQTRNIYRSGY